jgi:hypothetical protein
MLVKTTSAPAASIFYSKKWPSRLRQAFFAPENGRRARDERFRLRKMLPAPATGISCFQKWSSRPRHGVLAPKNGRRGGGGDFRLQKMRVAPAGWSSCSRKWMPPTREIGGNKKGCRDWQPWVD